MNKIIHDPGPTLKSFCYGPFLRPSIMINLVFLNLVEGYLPLGFIEIA